MYLPGDFYSQTICKYSSLPQIYLAIRITRKYLKDNYYRMNLICTVIVNHTENNIKSD